MGNGNVETSIVKNRVVYQRYLDVSIELAFEVWSSTEHLSQWWGPDGFTVTTNSFAFEPNGVWDFVMHGPDGHDYRNKIRFLEIKKPHHIYFRHQGDGEGAQDVDFETRVMFEREGEGTKLTMEQIFPTEDELQRVEKKYGAIEGGKQHLENIVTYTATLNCNPSCMGDGREPPTT